MWINRLTDALLAVLVVIVWFVVMTPIVVAGVITGASGEAIVFGVLAAMVWVTLRVVRLQVSATPKEKPRHLSAPGQATFAGNG